jgi:organic hydroperoxide reductase OsmC/OhrA
MMAEHRIALRWKKGTDPFAYETYPRNHEIAFKDGAVRVVTSSAPAFKGDAGKPDPEDLFVAALSSCHMLSFLAICARKKIGVESYEDDAVGFLENDGAKLWIARAILRPRVVFAPGAAPAPEETAHLHHMAHEGCFIANSVKTDLRIEPR